MNLAELKTRGLAAAKRDGITFDALLGEFGVHGATFDRLCAANAIDRGNRATATRLLPLVARLTTPGEVPALEFPNGVLLASETFAELRTRFFTHQPN